MLLIHLRHTNICVLYYGRKPSASTCIRFRAATREESHIYSTCTASQQTRLSVTFETMRNTLCEFLTFAGGAKLECKHSSLAYAFRANKYAVSVIVFMILNYKNLCHCISNAYPCQVFTSKFLHMHKKLPIPINQILFFSSSGSIISYKQYSREIFQYKPQRVIYRLTAWAWRFKWRKTFL